MTPRELDFLMVSLARWDDWALRRSSLVLQAHELDLPSTLDGLRCDIDAGYRYGQGWDAA